MALEIQNRIYVSTHNGEREIQLCLGDITQLPVRDTVDVIIVSAYQGDYMPMRGTVIGALKCNLGLNVEKLARFHKKEDLRKSFNCWISEYLPARMPYRQLMCFERTAFHIQKNVDLLTAMQDLFRAMQPLFNNQNKSVITPLLATGCQGTQHDVMLKELINTAVLWMRLGLPLQKLKIVIYVTRTRDHVTDQCIDLFAHMKTKIETKPFAFKEPEIKWDLFFVCSDSDNAIATALTKYTKKEKKNAQVCTLADIETKDSSWHHDIFTAMMASAKIVPLLSKSFLESEQCMDQYNIALCCNRFMTSRHLLAPVCLERINVPTYMGMVQWINCRGKEEEKLETASSILLDQISSGGESSRSKRPQYDVFLSYAHKNLDQALAFLQLLQQKDANLKVFFDYDELKTGVAWQKTLYNSIDGSRCFIALLSTDYQTSVVCTEEFNLALAKYHAKGNDMGLVALTIGDMDTKSAPYRGLKILNAQGNDFMNTATQIMDPLTDWLNNGTAHPEIFSDDTDLIDLNQLAETERKTQFNKFYVIDKDLARVTVKKLSVEKKDSEPKKVFVSYSLRDQGFVHMVTKLLKCYDPNVEISDKMGESTLQLDGSPYVIVFLSNHYRRSRKEVEEFNLILSKHRADNSRLYVITLGTMPVTPTYLSLVPSYTSLVDEFWEDVLPAGQGRDVLGDQLFSEMLELIGECQKMYHTDVSMPEALALFKCVCDLEAILSTESTKFYEKVGYPKGVFVNVELLQHRQLYLQKRPSEITLEDPGDPSQEINGPHEITNNPHEITNNPQEITNCQALDSTTNQNIEIDQDTSEMKNTACDANKTTDTEHTTGETRSDKTANADNAENTTQPTQCPKTEDHSHRLSISDDKQSNTHKSESVEQTPTTNKSEKQDGGQNEEAEVERDVVADLAHRNQPRKTNDQKRREWQEQKQREAERGDEPSKSSAMCHLL